MGGGMSGAGAALNKRGWAIADRLVAPLFAD